jgi:hypothetical protein
VKRAKVSNHLSSFKEACRNPNKEGHDHKSHLRGAAVERGKSDAGHSLKIKEANF